MPQVNSKIEILERVKRRLTHPYQSIKTSNETVRDPTTQGDNLDEVTLPTILNILLDRDEGLSTDSAKSSPENEVTQLTSRDPRELDLAVEIINLTFRQLKTFRQQLGHSNAHLIGTLPPEFLRDISRVIWVHWNSQLPGVAYKLKITIKNLLDHLNHSPITLSQSSATQFFFETIRRSVLLEKRSLSILSHLVPLLPVNDTLNGLKVYATDPAELLRILLNAIGDDKLASVSGQLALHWTTKLEGWQYRASKSINPSNDYRSDWIPITFSILFSSQERKRQHLCQYYLLPLFKTRAQCFVELTEALPSIQRSECNSTANSSDALFEYLSGLIALARLDPRQTSTQTQSSKKGQNLSEPWLPDELLRVCLSHPAVSLRSSAFAIICQSTSPTSHLSSDHLDLVLYFLTYNFGLVEPDLKQNISSNLNVLFNRLRNSSNSSKKKLVELIKRKSNQSNQVKKATSEIENLIEQHTSYLQIVKSFIHKFLKLCRDNLSISSPYRCQIASLSHLLILLNTGIDPLYHSHEGSSSKQPAKKQAWCAFKIKILDQSLINTLILALSSTYVNVREAAFTLLTHCSILDSLFQNNSKLKDRVLSYAVQCLSSKRESENCTASLLFRLVLAKHFIKTNQVSPSSLLTQNGDASVAPTNALAAFLWGRLDDLEARIIAAESNLGKACEDRPIQGSIMVLSELFKSLSKDMIGSLVASNDLIKILKHTRELIFRVWKLSAIVLCYSSDQQSDEALNHEEARIHDFISAQNEGDLMDNEDIFQLGSHIARTEHQIILSVCWRSMKEVSALLTQTVKLSLVAQEQTWASNGSVTFLSHQDLIEVGNFFEQWLLEIRHRGAFGAIHSSYSSLCESLCALPRDSTLSKLPLLWLQGHISAITNRKISTTRRSAGLPYCILSVCQALSSSDSSKLRKSLNSILDLVKSKEISSESQVHILNTLKILLTDGKVSTQMTSSFLEMSYDLAIKSFVSPDWKVRNGALILFSGLTTRVFGTRSLTLDRSHANLCKRETLSDFFRRLPKMPSILLDELNRSMQAGAHELSRNDCQGPIFAVLSLLGLLQNPDGAPVANDFVKVTLQCLKSKVSKIRSISADAMTGLIPCRDVPSWICDILLKTSSSTCFNQVHGFLLLVHRLIEVPSSLLEDEKLKIQATVASLAPKFLNSTQVPLICQSSFLEILDALESRFSIKLDSECTLNSDLLIERIKKFYCLRTPGFNSYETQATKNLLQQHQKNTPEIILTLLKEGYTATKLEVFKFLLKSHHQFLLNHPKISDLILSFARHPVHEISIRQSALNLLGITASGSCDLDVTRWPLEDLFLDYDESSHVVPIRDALLALSARIFVNSILSTHKDNQNHLLLSHWADKILDKIQEAAQEDQSAETRIFAVNGLKEFLKLYQMDSLISLSISNEIKLKVLEICIHLIQDDDDEIRFYLIKNLYQTNFFFEENLNKDLMIKKSQQEAKSGDKFQFGRGIQLELVPNIILEKLISMALKLDPFFGLKRLLKTVDIQSDLDQLANLSSSDLFVTERLNLFKDDSFEFNLIQRLSIDSFKHFQEKETIQDQKSIIEDNNNPNFSFVQWKEEEIKTFKNLINFLIPPVDSLSSLLTEEEQVDEESRAEIGDLFKLIYINNPNKNNNDDDCKLIRGDELGILRYRSWVNLITRLFHIMSLVNHFPPPIQSDFFTFLHHHHHHEHSELLITLDNFHLLLDFLKKIVISDLV